MSKKTQEQMPGPAKAVTMTREQEDSFLDEFPYLPNNRLTPAETRLIAQYGQEFGHYINTTLRKVKA